MAISYNNNRDVYFCVDTDTKQDSSQISWLSGERAPPGGGMHRGQPERRRKGPEGRGVRVEIVDTTNSCYSMGLKQVSHPKFLGLLYKI